MAKSFDVPDTLVDSLVASWKVEKERLRKVLERRVSAATQIVYNTARTRRPYIYMIGTTNLGYKKPSKKVKGTRKVSDPSAKLGVPVAAKNGGTLRASILKEVVSGRDKVRGKVYTRNKYAIFLEYGTSKMAARPFMRPALYENANEIKKIFGANA